MDVYPPPDSPPKAPRPAKRASFLGRSWRGVKFVAGGPIATIGLPEISEGATLIKALSHQLRSGPGTDPRLRVDMHGYIELEATAFLHGVSVEALLQVFLLRRRQTARTAYMTFWLGAVLLLVWMVAALQLRMNGARLLSAIEFLPFCVLFFLLAFKSAWMNWQLRTRRLGSAFAYLRTTEPFLPN